MNENLKSMTDDELRKLLDQSFSEATSDRITSLGTRMRLASLAKDCESELKYRESNRKRK